MPARTWTEPTTHALPGQLREERAGNAAQSNSYEGHETALKPTFWMLPWVQNIVPFASSVLVHASILLIGVVFFYGVTYVVHAIPHDEQRFPVDGSDSDILKGPPGGVPVLGSQHDNLPNAQEDVSNVPPETGVAQKLVKGLVFSEPGTGKGDSNDPVIGIGPGGGFGKGIHQPGGGSGPISGSGDCDGTGLLAPFGIRGGGSPGPQNPIFGRDPGAHRIAFLCDASGSMLNKFENLRRELAGTVQTLGANRSFSVIFFQEQGFQALDATSLIMATPENKLRAGNFMADKVTPRGETNPIPGLDLAFKQKPQLIYLLTDGDFPDNAAVRNRIRELNKDHSVKINTIAFVSESDHDTAFKAILQEIAQENGGIYRLVRTSDLQ